MRAHTIEYDGRTDVIMSSALIFEAVDIVPGVPIKNRLFSDNVVWDTGAEISVISSSVIQKLNLRPCAQTVLSGIAGDIPTNVYQIHLGLPNGYLYKNLYVYENDLECYDFLIGMDVISQSDFCFTNKDGKSVFSFKIPSEERIILQ